MARKKVKRKYRARLRAINQIFSDTEQQTIETEELDPIEVLRMCVGFLGKFIADGGHLRCCAPNAAIRAMQMAQAVLDKHDDENMGNSAQKKFSDIINLVVDRHALCDILIV